MSEATKILYRRDRTLKERLLMAELHAPTFKWDGDLIVYEFADSSALMVTLNQDLQPVEMIEVNQCASECDCEHIESVSHDPLCHSRTVCDEGRMCDKHAAEAMAEHSWMRGMSHGAVFGFLDDSEKQSLRDAGRGHLVQP